MPALSERARIWSGSDDDGETLQMRKRRLTCALITTDDSSFLPTDMQMIAESLKWKILNHREIRIMRLRFVADQVLWITTRPIANAE
jgi:hypothetical protein